MVVVSHRHHRLAAARACAAAPPPRSRPARGLARARQSACAGWLTARQAGVREIELRLRHRQRDTELTEISSRTRVENERIPAHQQIEAERIQRDLTSIRHAEFMGRD